MVSRRFTGKLPTFADNELPLKPPFEFGGMSARVFPLRANLDALQRLCDSYVNIAPPEIARFRAAVPYVYLMMVDYGRLGELVSNAGWFAQKELFFCVPLQYFKVIDGKWIFQDWAVITPFIYVDDDFSVPLGRTVYGWPKTIARLTPTLSRWMENPTAPIIEARVQTMVFPKLYHGRSLEPRVLLEVERDRTAASLQLPPDMRAAFLPWMVALHMAEAAVGLGGDTISMVRALGIFPADGSASATNFAAMARRLMEALGARLPGLIRNSINLKQFRDSKDPKQYCYQALTNGRVSTAAFNAGGFLGEDLLLVGDTSGGFSIKLHEWPSLPIIETLGLHVAHRWRGEGADVALLKPVMPFWYNVNMVYERGINLAWRTHDGNWHAGAPETKPAAAEQVYKAPDQAAAEEPESDATLFNTTLGSSVDAITGPFQFSGTTIRVLPLLAYRRTLECYLKRYLNDALDGAGARLRLWAPPSTNPQDDDACIDDKDPARDGYAYVYLMATSFENVTSKTNNIGDWAKFELAFLVPVRWECQKPGTQKWELEGVGLVPAYTFVDDITAAVARAEVLGIPTTRATFVQPESAWMSEDGADKSAHQMLLRVNAEVMPAIGEGQQSQVRPIVDISQGQPRTGASALETRVTPERWSVMLRQELERKKRTKRDHREEIKNARTFALELLGNHVPFALYTMKQFRDVEDLDLACYQSIVRVGRVLDEVHDVREIEETIHVHIYDFPTLPVVGSLGLVAKTIKEDDEGIVYRTQAIRPFALRALMTEQLGERLIWRAGKDDWISNDTVSKSILSGNTPITLGKCAEKAQDQGDARRLERTVRNWAAVKRREKPLTPVQGRLVVATIDPQMVIESVLSREWGNWDERARWRRGRRELEASHADELSAVTEAELTDAQARFFADLRERAGHRPGEPDLTDVDLMIESLTSFTTLRLKMEEYWRKVAAGGQAMPATGTRRQKHAVKISYDAGDGSQFLEFIQTLDRIAKLDVSGEPTAPHGETDFDARLNASRLTALLDTGFRRVPTGSKAKSIKGQRQGASVTAAAGAAVTTHVWREAVRLARKRCDLQREAVFNKLSRAWQKPDFCVHRDASGTDRDRLFPAAESWDETWYYGRAVGEPVGEPVRQPAK